MPLKPLETFLIGLGTGAVVVAVIATVIIAVMKKNNTLAVKAACLNTFPDGTNPIQIACVNHSSVVTQADFVKATAAIQKQVNRDFAPIWGVDAVLMVYNDPSSVPAGAWVMGTFDDADQANALGYHTLTNTGLPLGKVFAKTSLDNNIPWTLTYSHEVLEVLGDPFAGACIYLQKDESSGTIFCLEVCDPVEDIAYSYTIDDVIVSDFVLPSWFDFFTSQGPYDFKNHCSQPLSILQGGYALIYSVPNNGSGWQQVTSDTAAQTLGTAPSSKAQEIRTRPLCYRAQHFINGGRPHMQKATLRKFRNSVIKGPSQGPFQGPFTTMARLH